MSVSCRPLWTDLDMSLQVASVFFLVGLVSVTVCVQNNVKRYTDWDFKRLFLLLLNVENNVHFWLNTRLFYRRRNPESEELKPGDFESMVYSSFDSSKKTKFIIHGWLNTGNNYFSWQMKNAYLDTHDYNIISVDWSAYSKSLYTIARWSVNGIGPYVSKMVDFLIGEFGVSPEDVHLVGHSLGAHIAGLAGEHMKMGNVSRITGLDPAGPLFGGSLYRLDRSDANFVDVIHTSIRIVGYYPPIGHADFYPNGGGPLQPGCGFDIGFCTHLRSYKYFIESLYDEKGFEARGCISWHHFMDNKCSNDSAFMGEKVSHKARGNYYLRTGPAPPFALGSVLSNDSRLRDNSSAQEYQEIERTQR